MCSFNQAVAVQLTGAGKDNRGWFDLDRAQVYHDHFIEANLEGGVVIDFLKPRRTPARRACPASRSTSRHSAVLRCR